MSAELTLNHRTRDGGLLEPPSADEIFSIFKKYLTEIDNKTDKDKTDEDKKSSNFLENINKDIDNFLTKGIDTVEKIKTKISEDEKKN